MNHKQLLEKIKQQRMLPLFYHDDAETCVGTAKALYAAGIRIIEFTNRGAAALENFKQLVAFRDSQAPDLLLATGTIGTSKEVGAFAKAGADFLISPFYDEWVMGEAKTQNIPWIPGCATPTEIHTAVCSGCSLIKLFPGNLLGPLFVAAVKELFPGAAFMPTGGVEATKENLQGWFNAGVVAVGMGSRLITKKMLEEKDYTAIQNNTREALSLIQTINPNA